VRAPPLGEESFEDFRSCEGTPDFLFGGEVLGFSSEARRLAKNPQMLGLLGNLPDSAAD